MCHLICSLILFSLHFFSDRYTERVQHRAERKEFLAANPKVQDELSSHNVFKD